MLEGLCPGAGVQISEGVAGRSRCAVCGEIDRRGDRCRNRRGPARRRPRRCVQQGRAVARTGWPWQMAWLEARGNRDPGNPRKGQRIASRCGDASLDQLASGQSSLAGRGRHSGALFGNQYRPRGSLHPCRPRFAAAGGDAAALAQRPAVDGTRLCSAATCRDALPAAVPGFIGSRHDH